MKLSLTAKLFLAEVTRSAKQAIMGEFQNNPAFPKEDAAIDYLLEALDKCIPAESPVISKGIRKNILIWLARNIFKNHGLVADMPKMLEAMQSPTPVPVKDWFEDAVTAKETLDAFALALKEKRLAGAAASIESYNQIGDLVTALGKGKVEKDTGFNLDTLPETSDVGDGSGNPRQDVATGAQIIAQAGSWKMYRCEQQAGQGTSKEAMSWIGMNKWWGTTWCVGRDHSFPSYRNRPYVEEGNFYFLANGGKTKYAISSNQREADLIIPANSVIWSTNRAGQSAKFPSLEAAAQKLGVELDLSGVSSIPQEVVPILTEGVKADPYLAERIPESQLVQVDTSTLDKVVRATDAGALIDDLNKNFNHQGQGMVNGILARCVDRRGIPKDFSGLWDKFNDATLIAYIEALSSAGWKELPPSFEEYLVKEAENFEF